jgi:hypothetical protein
MSNSALLPRDIRASLLIAWQAPIIYICEMRKTALLSPGVHDDTINKKGSGGLLSTPNSAFE